MIDRIRELLKKCGMEVWRITETSSETSELYFIKKALDIPRRKVLTEYKVEIFRDMERDGARLRAMTNAILSPGMTDEEIEGCINDAYFAAAFAGNPWFELPAPVMEKHLESTSDIALMGSEKAVIRLSEGLFAADTAEDAFVNSAELFVTVSTTHIIASNGLDVCFDTCKAYGELVAQCVTPLDVEHYRSFEFDRLDMEGLRKLTAAAIRDVRARAMSSLPPSAGVYDIVLTGENVGTILEYYAARSSAAMIYPGYSQWGKGTPVQGKDIKGEKLELSFVPSRPFSYEGIPMIERELVNKGELELIHGDARFCYYLGTEATGTYSKLACHNGTKPYTELCSEGVLEPVSFSDFQMDVMDGHFKGEIRLAILHHADGSFEYLTGGSINGSLPDVQENMVFSAEKYEDSSYSGPLAVLLHGVAVAGA